MESIVLFVAIFIPKLILAIKNQVAASKHPAVTRWLQTDVILHFPLCLHGGPIM